MIIEDTEQPRLHPALLGQHATRGVVKIAMPEGVDLLGSIGFDLEVVRAVCGPFCTRRGLPAARLAQHLLGFHIRPIAPVPTYSCRRLRNSPVTRGGSSGSHSTLCYQQSAHGFLFLRRTVLLTEFVTDRRNLPGCHCWADSPPAGPLRWPAVSSAAPRCGRVRGASCTADASLHDHVNQSPRSASETSQSPHR